MRTLYTLLLLLATIYMAKAQESTTPPTCTETEVATPTPPAEQDVRTLWDEANTAYLRSDFLSAERIYRQILEGGEHSAKLYYNLANTYFKEERLGEAILYYHRALRLDPSDEDIRYNLTGAEGHTIDRIEKIPEFFLKGWMRSLRSLMSGTTWSILSLLWLTISLGAVLFYLLSQRLALRKAGFYATLCSLLLFALCCSFAAADRSALMDRSEAVILSPSVAVKSSPDKAATDLFVLHEGTTLRLSNTLGEWHEIILADGKKGWLESRHVEQI